MAKKGSKRPPTTEADNLSDRVERQQQAALAKAARDKIAKGETVPRREIQALRVYEKTQLKTLGQKYLASMPKVDFLELFKGTSKVYIEWRERYGFPWPDNRTGGVDVGTVMRYYRDRFAAGGGGQLPAGADEDDVLFQYASQDLKDELIRHRIREKDVTNRLKAIELQKALEGWAPIEPIRQWHNTLAELVLRAREKIVKRLDGEDKEAAEMAFDDLGDDMQRLTEEQFGTDDTNI